MMEISSGERVCKEDLFKRGEIKNELFSRQWFLLLIILGLVSLAYAPALKGSFVWDDVPIIVTNESIKSLNNISQFFLNPQTGFANYRPLRTLYFSLEYALWGLTPWGFHLSSLLLHLVNVSLVYFLLRSFFKDDHLPFGGALFFGLHPVQTEAVAWISAQADLLFTGFYLSAFLVYLKSRFSPNQRTEYLGWLLSLSLFVLALLSKEAALTLPLVLLAYEFLFRASSQNWNIKKLFLKLGGYLLVVGLYLSLRFTLLGVPPSRWGTKAIYIFLLDLKIIKEYTMLLLYPQNLCAMRQLAIPLNFRSGEILLSIFLVFLLLCFFFWGVRNNLILAFALAFIALNILPVLHWVEIPGVFAIAERWLYLPIFGFILLLMLGFKFLLEKARPHKVLNFMVLPLVAILLIFCTSKVEERLPDWQNDYSLLSQSTICAPHYLAGYMKLGMMCIQRGEVDKAISLFEKATRIEPRNPDPYINLGLSYKLKGNYEKAGQSFATAGALSDSKLELYFQAAWCYNQAGRKDLANKWWVETQKAGYKGPLPWEKDS